MPEITLKRELIKTLLTHLEQIREGQDLDKAFINCVKKGVEKIVAAPEKHKLMEPLLKTQSDENLKYHYRTDPEYGNFYDKNRTNLILSRIPNRRKMVIEGILVYGISVKIFKCDGDNIVVID
jgi:hypothetical protein